MAEPFVHPYLPNSAPFVKAAMLAETGAESVEDFYADVPSELRVDGLLELPAALPAEQDLVAHVTGLLEGNRPVPAGRSFLGCGTYRHFVPAVVDEVINRSEFLTSYAGEPYEDHGKFQALFEYQSLMAELLNMDVVNVPTYDGYQAAATALSMAARMTGRRRIVVASDVHPDKISRVRDFVEPALELVVVATVNGTADLAAVIEQLDDDTAALWIETPSFFGALETSLPGLAEAAHRSGTVVVAGTDPIALGAIIPPADQGADIVCGDIQSLGLHQWFGGAHGGFIAVHDDPRFVMELPSRLFGLAATDVDGEYGFGDVAYERTSFAVREEGKEWVGTAAALWGVAAAVYLSLMGPAGMAEIGETILARTDYAIRSLTGIDGIDLVDTAPHFREFVVDLEGTGLSAEQVIERLRGAGIEPGVEIGTHRLLVCVTEQNTKSDIDLLAAQLGGLREEMGA